MIAQVGANTGFTVLSFNLQVHVETNLQLVHIEEGEGQVHMIGYFVFSCRSL